MSESLLAHILEEGGRFAAGVLAPLNRVGDKEGSRLENGVVRTPDGWTDAYRAFVAAGWNAVPFDHDYGGQGTSLARGDGAAEGRCLRARTRAGSRGGERRRETGHYS